MLPAPFRHWRAEGGASGFVVVVLHPNPLPPQKTPSLPRHGPADTISSKIRWSNESQNVAEGVGIFHRRIDFTAEVDGEIAGREP